MTVIRPLLRFVTFLLMIGAFISFPGVFGFAPQVATTSIKVMSSKHFLTSLQSTSSSTDANKTDGVPSIDDINSQITVPKTLNEMINQVSTSIKLANSSDSTKPKTRQIIRILLPRDSKSAQLGQYFEEDLSVSFFDKKNIDLDSFTLIPPDETWQGGIMQLYRAISIPTRLILRDLGGTVGGVPPQIIEDRSIDVSEVDGVGIFQSQVPNNPAKDICCFVQPLQETVNVIESICEQAGKKKVGTAAKSTMEEY